MHTNDVARQVETQVSQQFLSRNKFVLSRDVTFKWHGGYIIPFIQ